MKYTRELLAPLVASSDCVSEVLRKLGFSSMSSGTHRHITKRIKTLGLDTSHFVGSRKIHKSYGGRNKVPWSGLLVKHEQRISTSRLRRAMIESGVDYRCRECGQEPLWHGKPLVLQIEHKNGDNSDCRPENVEFLCPNCHTQTPTHGKPKCIRPARTCQSCGSRIKHRNKSGHCVECYTPKMRNCKPVPRRMTPAIPTTIALLELVWAIPTTALAARLGVSDKAINKWCKKRGIPKPGPGYWRKPSISREQLKSLVMAEFRLRSQPDKTAEGFEPHSISSAD